MRPLDMRHTIAVAAMSLLGLAPVVARAGLPVPLTIQEALPGGITGLARAGGPVTVGIPLEESAGISNVSQLGLSGASAGQFRELARWPSGAIKWVLVDFQSDVLAGGTTSGVSLTTGSGNFGGSALAVDGGASIAISTGAASFTIQKSPFRFFDQVSVGGTGIVTAGGEGLVVLDGAGTRFTSANDAGGSVIIEENGPVRAVVRATGSLKNASGTRICDYAVRLHFYKGKSFARAFVQLRNAKGSSPTTFTFNSAEVAVPLSLGSGVRFATATSRGAVTDALGASETAYLFQAHSSRNDWNENAYNLAPMSHSGSTFDQRGVEVRKVGGTIYQALSGTDADYANGWAALEDGTGKGVAVGMRWMASQWPAGFEVSGDGTARVELFSKRNSKTGLKFSWGAYETRELFFHFYASPPANRELTRYEMEYPLAARAPLSQYASAGAIYGETQLVSVSEQQAWFSAHGASSPSLTNITPQFWRYHAWPTGGGGNQTDFALLDLTDFLRTGYGGYLAQGERNSMYKCDNAVRHSDGYDYTTSQIDPGDELGGLNQGAFNGKPFDFEHAHWVSIPIAYYLTGNEIFKEGFVDFGEWKLGMGDGFAPLYYNPVNILGDGMMRVWSRYYRDFAILYDVTRDVRHWNNLSTMTTALINSKDVPGSPLPAGRNLDRGYVWMAHGDYQLPRFVSDFMTVQIHSEAAWEVLRLLKERGDSRIEAMEDYLLGLADFIYNEWYFDVGTGYGQFGYLYSYKLDEANNSSTNPYYPPAEIFRPISSARPLLFAYQMTGDTKYLTREAKLLIGDIGYVTDRTPTESCSEAFMNADLNRPVTGWHNLSGVTAQNLGGGSYRLTWTVPAGTTAYRIKYADKSIVDWLGFNQATRVYQYPPATYTAWFAANNVTNEPAPSPPGSPETFTVTGLDPLKAFQFAVRYTTTSADNTAPAAPQGLVGH
jgi:exo-rhamnogalacturonan lyase-like protein